MQPYWIVAIVAFYALAGRWLRRVQGTMAEAAFACLNISVVFVLFFYANNPKYFKLMLGVLTVFIGLSCAHYVLVRRWGVRDHRALWMPFFAPIAFLVFIRYFPILSVAGYFSGAVREMIRLHPTRTVAGMFVGLSYVTFRASYLVVELRSGQAQLPSLWRYLGFLFFAPTFSVGPISRYGLYEKSSTEVEGKGIGAGAALQRAVMGAAKFGFIAPIVNQLSYSGLMLDGYKHGGLDFIVAVFSYYVYLYFNFSGLCDIAVGVSGLMNIEIAENFDNPFLARNPREFWNRWHITLSQWMRDVVFSPLSRSLTVVLGGQYINHAIGLSIFVVFLLVGIWHGAAWNYAAYGLVNAVGVVANHYYTMALKRWLGREGFAAYNRNRAIGAVAIVLNWVFIACSLFFFANDTEAMLKIGAALSLR